MDDDDDETTTDHHVPGSQTEVSRIHRGVNLSRLAIEGQEAAGQWPVEVWAAAVDLILDRARSRVSSPQRYVTGSITREPAVMLDAAETVAGADAGLAQSLWAAPTQGTGAAAGAAAVRRITCPIHQTDHREDRECGGCRADRLAQRPQEG